MYEFHFSLDIVASFNVIEDVGTLVTTWFLRHLVVGVAWRDETRRHGAKQAELKARPAAKRDGRRGDGMKGGPRALAAYLSYLFH